MQDKSEGRQYLLGRSAWLCPQTSQQHDQLPILDCPCQFAKMQSSFAPTRASEYGRQSRLERDHYSLRFYAKASRIATGPVGLQVSVMSGKCRESPFSNK